MIPSLDAVTAAALAVSNAGRPGYGPKIQPAPSGSKKRAQARHIQLNKSAPWSSTFRRRNPRYDRHYTSREVQELGWPTLCKNFTRMVNDQGICCHRCKHMSGGLVCFCAEESTTSPSGGCGRSYFFQLNLLYNWLRIPLQSSFELLDQSPWHTVADLVL